jgi:hydroxymethylpyrimidine pyrophosphatase-like HAD family hydrolase
VKPISALSSDEISKIKLISFDSDGVLVKKGTEISQSADGHFSQKTNFVSPSVLEKLILLKKRFHLVINSGRSSLYLSQIYQDILWDNVTFISEIGSFITGGGFMIQTEPLNDYELKTIKNIRAKLSKLIGDHRVKGFEPKQFLTTLHCYSEVPEVAATVKDCDPENKFYCWWNLEAYDINSAKFTKIKALLKFISLIKLNPSEVMVVGNGINDRDSVTKEFLNISTDPSNLAADDYSIEGEHLGGEILLDHLVKLIS